MSGVMFNLRGKWLGIALSLVICLAVVFSAALPMAAEDAEEGFGGGEPYTIMHPDREMLERWIEGYNSAPRAYIKPGLPQAPGTPVSQDLLSHLDYIPADRNQGYCGNCWAWAGTGCMEVALDIQEGIHERLSVQYVNSCKAGNYSCCGGSLQDLVDFYDPAGSGTGRCIPWDNSLADWCDYFESCATAPSFRLCSWVSTDPSYAISSIQATVVETQPVSKSTAIANIKNVLDQNKAVWFGFRLPDDSAWTGPNGFQTFWADDSEDDVYAIDQFCGDTWVDGQGGGHAVLCVGYYDDGGSNSYWVMLNSWGTGDPNNRPSGLFRIDMDMQYDCTYPYETIQVPAFEWWTLEVDFSFPDISAEPGSFEVTLPPDMTQDSILTIANDGAAELSYDIGDESTLAPGNPPPDEPAQQPEEEEMLLYMDELQLDVLFEGNILPTEQSSLGATGWQNIMTDDFEGSFPGVWSIYRAIDSFGDVFWGKDCYRNHTPGGSCSAFCAKNGEDGVDPPDYYPYYFLDFMKYGPFSLEDATEAELSFSCWYDIGGDFDYMFYGLSTDDSTFCGRAINGGASGDWFNRSCDLTDWCGGNLCGEPEVWILFSFHNDKYNLIHYGAFVDDVVLRKKVGGQDCPWLDENPKSASVLPGDGDNITVSVNTTGLAEGDYGAEIVISSNDPDENPTVVPVTLHVALPDLIISEKYEEWVNFEAKTYNITYTVTNQGGAPAGASKTGIYTLDDNSWVFCECPELAPGASDSNTVGPFTMSGGSDSILVYADKYYAVAESNEDNNWLGNDLGTTVITGITTQVNCDILPGVSIQLFDADGVTPIGAPATSDGSGNYTLAASVSETGDYKVFASKTEYRDESQTISITVLGQEYEVNFRGDTGLVPNEPDASYAMDCVHYWLFPPGPECGLSASKAMDVIHAWLFPVKY